MGSIEEGLVGHRRTLIFSVGHGVAGRHRVLSRRVAGPLLGIPLASVLRRGMGCESRGQRLSDARAKQEVTVLWTKVATIGVVKRR